MRSITLLAMVFVCVLAAPARAEDEFDAEGKPLYPSQLAKRPLVLNPGMLEITVGGASDFAAASGAKSDQIRTLLSAAYSPFIRGEVALETDIRATGGPAGDDGFNLNDATGWFEYSLHPTMSVRGGLYAAQMGGDTVFGARVGVPMKWKLNEKAAVVSGPRWGKPLTGDVKLQQADLPIGIQFALMPTLSWYATTGVGTIDFKFEKAFMYVPLQTGLVIHPSRTLDIGAEFMIPDLYQDSGFDNRWVSAWIAIRK